MIAQPETSIVRGSSLINVTPLVNFENVIRNRYLW